MKVEILIYSYLAICTAMIIFNIVCIFVFRKKDKDIERRSIDFKDGILKQIESETIDKKHTDFLCKKLKKINHMMAFDETLEKLYEQMPREVERYISDISSVFVYLTFKYSEKDKIQAAYFPYIIKKYNVFKGVRVDVVVNLLTELVKNTNLYCRENALQALYSIGDADSVINALKILDKRGNFHHTKMIADGLLSYSGDRQVFDEKLWENYSKFSDALKIAVLDYFRFSSGNHAEKMLGIMENEKEDRELRFSAIRYFAKYRYEPALPCLYDFAGTESYSWEYKAIAATALGNYPSLQTEEMLKDLLCDKNWYVRYNASGSLEMLGVSYEQMIDIFEGHDRYASEMLRYRFDRKKLKEKEGATV